jgi:hypothetical protein
MLRAYETPELTIHGSIAMLTRDEGPDACPDGSHPNNTKDPKDFPGDAKPDKPEYDVYCLFSHSPGAES